MRRAIVAVLAVVLIIGMMSGCTKDQAKIQEEFLEIAKEPATEEGIDEIEIFLGKNLSKLDKENASHMVSSYEDYILNCSEYSGLDYEKFANQYQNYVYKPLTELYNIRAQAQKKPMEVDAELQYSWAEICEKAWEMEEFINRNKKDEKIKHLIEEDAGWIYGNYINAMMIGTNRTPIFDVESKQFSEEAKKSYEAFIEKNPDTVTAWALKEYLDYVASIDYTLDYNDKIASKTFFDTCTWIVSEAKKRVFQ